MMLLPSRVARLLLALAVLLPATALAGEIGSADQSAKQLSKTLAKDFKSRLKDLKADINTATGELKSELKQLTQISKSGDANLEDASDLFDALRDFQSAMAQVAEDADGFYAGIFNGLGDLDPSDDSFLGAYPDDFMPGAGGRHDDYLADVEAALAEPYKALNKQLAKLRALAEKKSGLLLNLRLAPVNGLFEQAVNDGAVTSGGRRPLGIDLTLSARDAGNNRAVWVAGSATNFGGDLPVLLSGVSASTQDAQFTSQHRFERVFNGPSSGNYLIVVQYQGDDSSVRQTIGLR